MLKAKQPIREEGSKQTENQQSERVFHPGLLPAGVNPQDFISQRLEGPNKPIQWRAPTCCEDLGKINADGLCHPRKQGQKAKKLNPVC
jgi:hypothetical protein